MGPLLSKLLSPPLSISGGPAGGRSYQPGEQRAAKAANSEAMFTSPTYLSEGGVRLTTQSSLPSPKGKSDLEVRLEEATADQVVAIAGKANMSPGELGRGWEEVRSQRALQTQFLSMLSLGK